VLFLQDAGYVCTVSRLALYLIEEPPLPFGPAVLEPAPEPERDHPADEKRHTSHCSQREGSSRSSLHGIFVIEYKLATP